MPKLIRRISFSIILIWVLSSSCKSGVQSSSTQQSAPYTFDDTLYCFNQRSIVHKNGLAGIIDDSGKVILAPEWDSIEFLDDDIALLCRDSLYCLCTRDGRIFSENKSAYELELNYRDILSRTLEDDIRNWDKTLDKLDALCSECLRLGKRRPDQATKAAYEEFQSALGKVSGQMNTAQQERFEEIVRRFNTFSGR